MNPEILKPKSKKNRGAAKTGPVAVRSLKIKFPASPSVCQRMLKDPSVIHKIESYAKEVAPELLLMPESNLFPKLCRVISRAVQMGCVISGKLDCEEQHPQTVKTKLNQVMGKE